VTGHEAATEAAIVVVHAAVNSTKKTRKFRVFFGPQFADLAPGLKLILIENRKAVFYVLRFTLTLLFPRRLSIHIWLATIQIYDSSESVPAGLKVMSTAGRGALKKDSRF